MEPIEIIKTKAELEGTCYIELAPGKYQGKHWESTSLFFDEEIFGLIEPIFEKHVPNYDHYSMNDADSTAWVKIIYDLNSLVSSLDSASEFSEILGKVGFIFSGTRDSFQTEFLVKKHELQQLVIELTGWAEEKIGTHGSIAILGI